MIFQEFFFFLKINEFLILIHFLTCLYIQGLTVVYAVGPVNDFPRSPISVAFNTPRFHMARRCWGNTHCLTEPMNTKYPPK